MYYLKSELTSNKIFYLFLTETEVVAFSNYKTACFMHKNKSVFRWRLGKNNYSYGNCYKIVKLEKIFYKK